MLSSGRCITTFAATFCSSCADSAQPTTRSILMNFGQVTIRSCSGAVKLQWASSAERFAQQSGCRRIESHVDRDAVGFYERCGFETLGDSQTSGASVLMGKRIL